MKFERVKEEIRKILFNVDNVEDILSFDPALGYTERQRILEEYKNYTIDDAIEIIRNSNELEIFINEFTYDYDCWYRMDVVVDTESEINVLTIVYNITMSNPINKNDISEETLSLAICEIEEEIADWIRTYDWKALSTLIYI